jgi:hypothetical protein
MSACDKCGRVHRGGRYLPGCGGRSAPEPGSRITVWVPTRVHDRLAQLATRHGESLSAIVRMVITRRSGL